MWERDRTCRSFVFGLIDFNSLELLALASRAQCRAQSGPRNTSPASLQKMDFGLGPRLFQVQTFWMVFGVLCRLHLVMPDFSEIDILGL